MSSHPETVTLTRGDIEEALRQIGLTRGDIVEVHSSLSSLGWVEGGAATVVDALMNVVGQEGALVMSAYFVSKPLPLTEQEKARGLLAKVRLYDRDYDGPTGMGAVADEFRRRPGTVLGPDDGGPICAWGRNAEWLSQGYESLVEADGWALLIGVDIYRCSSMHVAENRVAVPKAIGQHYQLPEDILRDYPPEEWYVIHSEPTKSEPQPASESIGAWEKVQAEAECRGLIVKQRIGNAACMLFKARQLVEIYAEARRSDPFGLYNVERER